MALSFAIGSLCFLVGPFPGYAGLVGAEADAITFFVGSIFFTAGGALQTSLAWHERGSAAWWTAVIQSAGTLCFNVSTFLALHTSLSDSDRVTVLSRGQLYLLLDRTGRAGAKTVGLDDALDVARHSQADTIVLGSFASLGGKVRVDVRLHDGNDGRLLASESLVVPTAAS